jgi:hypothetical protein
MEAAAMKVGRSWLNWASGWFLGVGILLMFVIVVDPLYVQRRPDSDLRFDAFGISFVVGAYAFTMVSMRLFSLPSVFMVDGVLHIKNPLREWTVPVDLIEGTDDNLTYVRVHAGGRKIICAGLEKTNAGIFTGSSLLEDRLAEVVGSGTPAPSARQPPPEPKPQPADQVTWRWVGLQRSEAILSAIWVAYLVVGAFRHYY